MIAGIGHDIVKNERIEKLYKKYNEHFVRKILSPTEQEIFLTLNPHRSIQYLAKRFSAKEAFAKACRTGVRTPILMPSISILNDKFGKPYFEFALTIKEWLIKQNISTYSCHLSITDEDDLSSSFVILEYHHN